MIPHQLTVPRLLIALSAQPCTPGRSRITASSGVPRGVVWGEFNHPPRISEDIGGVLDRMSKNRRLDYYLKGFKIII